MKFGSCPLDQCESSILAHSIYLPVGKVGKGTILTKSLLTQIAAAGVQNLTVAKLEVGDLDEDAAATRLALSLLPENVRLSLAATGRINVYAKERGILRIDRDMMRAINMVDEGITFASVQHNQLLEAGDMIATLKIIPYSVTVDAVAAVEAIVGARTAFTFCALNSVPFGLIQTTVSGMKNSILSATEAVTKHRLNQLDCPLVNSQIVEHNSQAIQDAITKAKSQGAEVLLICGASAIADRRDVVPLGIEAAGGAIDHLGLPADPGNLLMVAQCDDMPIIGMPGCARSPKLNGFDWVLHLLLAKLPLSDAEIADMAVGGLLMEIASRPLPRKMTERRPNAPVSIGGIVLAAGQSRRMEGQNKLVAEIDGVAMVRRCVMTLQDSGIKNVIVVTGYQQEKIEAALAGLDVQFVHNVDYVDGQGGSVSAGVAALTDDNGAALIALGDMPDISQALVKALIADHMALPNSHSRISFPVHDGKRGNPVIWGRAFFEDLKQLAGDRGGRQILGMNTAAINSLGWHEDSIHQDIDTPADLMSRTTSG